jgi:hypothetical protein
VIEDGFAAIAQLRILNCYDGEVICKSMKKAFNTSGRRRLGACILVAVIGTHTAQAQTGGNRTLFLPLVAQRSASASASGCTTQSSNTFGTIAIAGGFYKNNALTDENADFRLSVIGYAQVNAPLELVNYNGDTDANAPKLSSVLRPERVPEFAQAYKRNDWKWNEQAAPPYGTRGGINSDWPVSVIDFASTPGEAVYIPRRAPEIGGGFNAMVLFAAETELSIVYYRQDSVVDGYLIHMLNFCVDPNLVSTYQAQLLEGKRASGSLPGVKNSQQVGTARTNAITIAVRDRGGYLDPRSRKDWWP